MIYTTDYVAITNIFYVIYKKTLSIYLLQ